MSRILDRERIQKHGVGEREEGRVGADAQSERQNRNSGESRAVSESAEGVLQILQQRFHDLFIDERGRQPVARILRRKRRGGPEKTSRPANGWQMFTSLRLFPASRTRG